MYISEAYRVLGVLYRSPVSAESRGKRVKIVQNSYVWTSYCQKPSMSHSFGYSSAKLVAVNDVLLTILEQSKQASNIYAGTPPHLNKELPVAIAYTLERTVAGVARGTTHLFRTRLC